MSENREPKAAFPSRLRALWRGEISLGQAFWWYGVIIGSFVNVLASVLFAVFSSLNVPGAVAVAAFLSPIPYNLFVAIVVWRSAGHYEGPPLLAHLARLVVTVWALVASFT